MADTLPKGWIDQEIGTAADAVRMFNYVTWLDGTWTNQSGPKPSDIDTMLGMDGKARSIEQVLTLPLRQAKWSIEPVKGDSGECEQVTSQLTAAANANGMSTPLDLVIGQMTSACTRRIAFFEKVFAIKDGKVTYDKVAYRPASTCTLKRDKRSGAFDGFTQQVLNEKDFLTDVTIPAGRAFTYVHGQHRDPMNGISDLDVTWRCYDTKQKIRFLYLAFLEGAALPKTVWTHSRPDDPDGKRTLARAGASLRNLGAIAIDKDQSFATIQPGSGQPFLDAMAYMDREMASSVLAVFLELGASASSGRGSYALSKDQTDLFLQSRESVHTEMASAICNWLIADLVKYNYGPDAKVPRFVFEPLTAEDIDRAVTLLQQVSQGNAQQSKIPSEFVDELCIRVAGSLGLNVDKVSSAIKKAQEQAPPTPVGQVGAAVNVAAKAMQSAPVASPPIANQPKVGG